MADATIANLHSLGIFRHDEIGVREKMIGEKVREWNTASANAQLQSKTQMSIADKRNSTQLSIANTRAALAERNLSARWAGVMNSANRNDLTSLQLQLGQYDKAQTAAQTDLEKINGDLTNLQVNNQADSDLYTQLAGQANALQTSINANDAQVGEFAARASNAAATRYSNITGNPSVVLGAPPITVNVGVPGGQAAPPPAAGAQGQGAGQKVASRADVEVIAKKYGKSVDQVIRDYQAHGYTVQ
jgi:hypothetical protein